MSRSQVIFCIFVFGTGEDMLEVRSRCLEFAGQFWRRSAGDEAVDADDDNRGGV